MSKDKERPNIVYVAKFVGNTEHHYDVKEEQAYVADRRTPLEAPYRDKDDFSEYLKRSHVDDLLQHIQDCIEPSMFVDYADYSNLFDLIDNLIINTDHKEGEE